MRRKRNAFRNVVLSWAVLGAVAFAGGVGAGIALSGNATAENPIYGQAEREFIATNVPMDVNVQKHVYDMAKVYNLDYAFLMAVIKQESEFEIYTVSDGGDYGLMQINRINHPSLSITLGIHDFLDPYDNVRAGAYMLRDLFDKYHDPHKVLMAYQMGETGASAYWKQGIMETGYSRSVLRIQKELERQMNPRLPG